MSHDAGSEAEIGSIMALTYGILFFGVPEHAKNSFDNLAAVTSHDESAAVETPLMQALRRDLLWQQESNAAYSRICNHLITRYFMESSSEIAAGDPPVSTTIVDVIIALILT